MERFWTALDRIESYICRTLLAGFVTLLFTQIVSRQLLGRSISWIEELSVYMFVWFVFFGASYAARINAHNRVTFHLNLLLGRRARYVEAFADLLWIAFNLYFVYLAIDFIFNRMNRFWKSQTLGVEMKYVYLVLPIAFFLMTIRILQVNYDRMIRGVDQADPDLIDVDELKTSAAPSSAER